MFAARQQENLVHAHQSAAASKPLNQGARALQSRTPAVSKTPFRGLRHDENQHVMVKGQKTVTKDAPSKLDSTAFATPAGTRNRAPLGVKTANAKAQPLKTPGPAQHSVRREKSANRNTSTRRSAKKIHVVPTESIIKHAIETNAEDDEPDFGYAPPPITELPDVPLEFGYDQSFPQFRPENMTRGYGEIFFGSPTDENGISLRLKQEEDEHRRQYEQSEMDLMDAIMTSNIKKQDPDAQVDAMIRAGPKPRNIARTKESRVDTVKAKSVVSLLSGSSVRLPGAINRQTKSSLLKQTSSSENSAKFLTSTKSGPVRSITKAPLPIIQSTIGFPRAKKAPSIIPSAQRARLDQRQPSSKQLEVHQSEIDPCEFVDLFGEPPLESEMWFRWQQRQEMQRDAFSVFETDDDLADEFADIDLSLSNYLDVDDNFQLPMPEY